MDANSESPDSLWKLLGIEYRKQIWKRQHIGEWSTESKLYLPFSWNFTRIPPRKQICLDPDLGELPPDRTFNLPIESSRVFFTSNFQALWHNFGKTPHIQEVDQRISETWWPWLTSSWFSCLTLPYLTLPCLTLPHLAADPSTLATLYNRSDARLPQLCYSVFSHLCHFDQQLCPAHRAPVIHEPMIGAVLTIMTC